MAVGALLALATVTTACGGGSDDTKEAAGPPAACVKPPLTMQVQGSGSQPAGSDQLKVTDAVARRVALLPKAPNATPADLAKAKEQAATTSLAYYTMYLADFPITRSTLKEPGSGDLAIPKGKTLGTVTFVPVKKRGFRQGDVARSVPLEYEMTSTITPLMALVREGPDEAPQSFNDAKGKVTIRYLTKTQICTAIDLQLLNGEKVVYEVRGTVLAPIVRADPSYFFT